MSNLKLSVSVERMITPQAVLTPEMASYKQALWQRPDGTLVAVSDLSDEELINAWKTLDQVTPRTIHTLTWAAVLLYELEQRIDAR